MGGFARLFPLLRLGVETIGLNCRRLKYFEPVLRDVDPEVLADDGRGQAAARNLKLSPLALALSSG